MLSYQLSSDNSHMSYKSFSHDFKIQNYEACYLSLCAISRRVISNNALKVYDSISHANHAGIYLA